MASFEFARQYHNSPFSHSGPSMGGMSDPHGLMFEQLPTHNIYDMMPPQGLSTPGPSNGSTPNLHAGDRAETKPRLHKDEVTRLEKIFLENHKPNSNIKRGLADQMGVEVARINNWFQNRRAKAKQEKKQDEFEQRQKLAESSSQEEPTYQQQELYPDSYELEAQSHSSFSSTSGPRTASIISCQPQYEDPTAASLDSFDRSMEAARAAAGTFVNEHVDLSPTPRMSFPENCMDSGVGGDRAQFPSSDDLNSWNETNFADPLVLQQPHSIPFQAEIEPPMNQDPVMSFNEYADGNELNGVNPLTNNNNLLPSQLLSPNLNMNQTNSQAHEDFVRHFEQPEFAKPESEDEHQPQADGMLRFRSPPTSINIAARRRGNRPAALGTTPRNSSCVGPRTATHSPTINRSGVMPLSPMRRIASVSNLGSYSNVNGSRVQKSYPTSAQRSPINMKGFSDPEAFFETNARSIKRPSLPVSIASSVHPPTPMSPEGILGVQRETTASSSSSDDTNRIYDCGTLSNGYFVHSEFGDPKLVSPPVTPAFYPEIQPHWAAYNVSDEALHTPANMAFGPEVYPYLSSLGSSQPDTPGLPTYQASGYNYNYGHAQYGLHASPNSSNDNLYPGANQYAPGFVKSSPISNKELHFENHTAKDYEAVSK